MKQYGYMTLDMPPAENNPRNSEGAFYTLKNGNILFIYSRFVGKSWDDEAYATLASRESCDGGETWSEYETILTPEDDDAVNIMSVSLIEMENGNIGLIYIIRREAFDDMRAHIRRSSDQGKTWSEAVPCVNKRGNYCTHNDRVIRLKSGRLLMPGNLHRSTVFDPNDYKAIDSLGMPCIFYSDDDGKTWDETDHFGFISNPNSKCGFQESGVVELSNGLVYQFIRTDMSRQYESYSHDGGLTWSVPVPSRFTSPVAPMSIKKMPGTNKLFAVWNPVPDYFGKVKSPAGWGRSPLVLAMSEDDGRTWSDPIVLEDDPTHGFCYTSIHFTPDSLLLSYCAGGPKDGICLTRLVIRKISLSEL